VSALWTWSLAEALLWVARLVGFALVVDALELGALRRAGVLRIWTDPLVTRDLALLPAPLAALSSAALSSRGLVAVQLAHGGAAGALLVLGPGPWAAVALLAHVLVCMRWRGTFNGGSDQLKVVVLSGLTVAAVHPALAPLGLAYVASQVVLSYFVAGVVKVMVPMWRSGDALYRLAALPRYAVSAGAARTLARGAWPLAWGLMLLELLFPLVFAGPRMALLLLTGTLLFHVVNAAVLGLNRFLWAWLSAYPAVLWASTLAAP
jgi:hypothetical protein